MPVDDWHGLYGESWKGVIIDEAFCHPAKFSRALIRRIYEHAIEEGWLQEGDRVLDPFGGVALGGLDAMHQGLHWIGGELEQKFVDLGNQNIELWAKTLGQHMRRWGSAVLLQGDSRKLGEVIAGVCEGVVSSPPWTSVEGTNAARKFADPEDTAERRSKAYREGTIRGHFASKEAILRSLERANAQTYGDSLGQLGSMPEGEIDAAISSPPYSSIRQDGGGQYAKEGKGGFGAYTDESPDTWHTQRDQANIGNLREPQGDFEAVVSSPPYATEQIAKNSRSIDRRKQWETYRAQGGGMGYEAFVEQQERHSFEYGKTNGQLQAMQAGSVDAAISSPPYAGARIAETGDLMATMRRSNDGVRYGGTKGQLGTMTEGAIDAAITSPSFEASTGSDDPEKRGGLYRDPKRKKDISLTGTYGETEGQLGQEQAETFWSAAKLIVEQVYALLKPGGHAIWVVKRFVRDKQIVDFPGQWLQLCEHVGFRLVCRHRAWLVEDRGTQIDLFGNHIEKTVARKSFFRRLYESKYPENSIDWEDVICMEKPA